MMVSDKKYEVIKDGKEYMIGIRLRPDAIHTEDGIFNYYWWETKEEAQKAADMLNEYNRLQKPHFLDQVKRYGNSIIFESEVDDYDPEIVKIHRVFGAIKEG